MKELYKWKAILYNGEEIQQFYGSKSVFNGNKEFSFKNLDLKKIKEFHLISEEKDDHIIVDFDKMLIVIRSISNPNKRVEITINNKKLVFYRKALTDFNKENYILSYVVGCSGLVLNIEVSDMGGNELEMSTIFLEEGYPIVNKITPIRI